MASQRFCLRWNNHQSNLLTVFDQLLHAETFTDVTLAIDGQYLKAHKMVLSACSPYFQQLFINHEEKHPIVILRDVPYADMKSLLDFMYRGEVSVDQERLSAFLRVAESLRIKGLTEVNDDKPANGNSSSNNNSTRDQTDTPLSSSSQQNRMQSYVQQQQQQRKVLQQQQQISQQSQQQGLTSSSPIGSSGPKRKRGRPRKLSGSDDVDDYDDDYRENLLQDSPDILDVKINTDNETNSEETESRRRTVDTDEQDSRSLQKRQNDDTQTSNNSKKDDTANDGLLVPKEEPMEVTPDTPMIRISDFAALNPTETMITPPSIRTKHVKISSNNDHNNDSTAIDINTDNNSDAWIKQDDNSFMKSPIIITSNNSSMSSPTSGGKSVRRRIRRKNNSPDDQAESLTEMSVRGLNLFRYAAVQDGVYQCTECLKENVNKTFKNKYSFQRHAFLYHEGTQRKVFPCPVCRKEFSRPDKMKNHMKMTHECYMPKECKFPIPLLMQAGSSQSAQIAQPMNNNNVVATSQ